MKFDLDEEISKVLKDDSFYTLNYTNRAFWGGLVKEVDFSYDIVLKRYIKMTLAKLEEEGYASIYRRLKSRDVGFTIYRGDILGKYAIFGRSSGFFFILLVFDAYESNVGSFGKGSYILIVNKSIATITSLINTFRIADISGENLPKLKVERFFGDVINFSLGEEEVK